MLRLPPVTKKNDRSKRIADNEENQTKQESGVELRRHFEKREMVECDKCREEVEER